DNTSADSTGTDSTGANSAATPAAATIGVLVGPAGTGKTATALRWAHDAAAAYPDGRLFADLNAFGPGRPAEPAAVLGRFLQALGVPESELPEDRSARAALYRSLSRDRRLLVVLDDVADAGDLTDLLPAGPGCATVVTSRSTLADLVVTEGAALLRLGPLPAEEAGRLLEHLLGRPRVAAEPEAAARVAGCRSPCGSSPPGWPPTPPGRSPTCCPNSTTSGPGCTPWTPGGTAACAPRWTGRSAT
ncbi:ATP-binding protein, partial [Streptomyces sp. NRRL S-495]|uniref:AAA family ATPase n=1 Tax=Streptomyces sp. NRRL S-495 TaxID=1609133 RepID=UPI000AB72949